MKKLRLITAVTLFASAALLLVPEIGLGQAKYQDYATATAVSGAATLNASAGTITTESLATVAGSTYTLTVTNNKVTSANCVIGASLSQGTNTAGIPDIQLVTPGAGSFTVTLYNRHASAALNGTLKISFAIASCSG
jgi:hypothetical protein